MSPLVTAWLRNMLEDLSPRVSEHPSSVGVLGCGPYGIRTRNYYAGTAKIQSFIDGISNTRRMRILIERQWEIDGSRSMIQTVVGFLTLRLTKRLGSKCLVFKRATALG